MKDNGIRRVRITTVFVVSVMMLVSCVSLSYVDAADDSSDDGTSNDPIRHNEMNGSKTVKRRTVDVSSSLAFMGAEWSESRQAWGFNYRFAGLATTNDYYNLRMAGMEIEATSNAENMALWTSNDKKYIGSVPGTANGADYSRVALAVAEFALSAFGGTVTLPWSAIQFVLALGDSLDSSVSNPDRIWRNWEWNGWVDDTGQFLWFIVDVEPNQTVKFSYEYGVIGLPFELYTLSGNRTLTAGPPDNRNDSYMNPDKMSASELDLHGIETIPRDAFLSRASELNISQRSVLEFLTSNEAEFYYAHSFVEYETPQEDTESNWSSDPLVLRMIDQMYEDVSKRDLFYHFQLIKEIDSPEQILNMDERTMISNDRKSKVYKISK